MNQLQLLTIIAQDALASLLEEEILGLGAKGYTISAVTGKSPAGERDNPWYGSNIKLEIILSQESCDRILSHLEKKYFDRFSIIAFHHPVQVIRTHRFV